jgi:hypothetical protein
MSRFVAKPYSQWIEDAAQAHSVCSERLRGLALRTALSFVEAVVSTA